MQLIDGRVLHQVVRFERMLSDKADARRLLMAMSGWQQVCCRSTAAPRSAPTPRTARHGHDR